MSPCHSIRMLGLKLRQHGLGTRNRNFSTGFLLSVDNLAVINDHRISSSALSYSPVKLLRKRGTHVRQEELQNV